MGRGDRWGLKCWKMCGVGILWLAEKEDGDSGEERGVWTIETEYIFFFWCARIGEYSSF